MKNRISKTLLLLIFATCSSCGSITIIVNHETKNPEVAEDPKIEIDSIRLQINQPWKR